MMCRFKSLMGAALTAAVGLAAGQSVAQSQSGSAASAPGAARVVEVTAVDYAFRAPDSIPAGWTTIRFQNEGEEAHFALVTRLPDGKTVDDYEHELSEPFHRAWQARLEGRATEEEALGMIFDAMPEWFGEVRFMGGPGIAAPGVTSEVTMNLDAGDYVLECYAKTEDGEVHYMEGMIRPLTVTPTGAAAAPPAADIRVTLSNFEMAVDGDLTPGRRTVEVHVAENPEQGFGHSVHVGRLAGTDVDRIVGWMNWLDLQGFRTPAPTEFLGGVHQMPTGSTAYFTIDLEPGNYLFVSEATGAQGVLQEVTVR